MIFDDKVKFTNIHNIEKDFLIQIGCNVDTASIQYKIEDSGKTKIICSGTKKDLEKFYDFFMSKPGYVLVEQSSIIDNQDPMYSIYRKE